MIDEEALKAQTRRLASGGMRGVDARRADSSCSCASADGQVPVAAVKIPLPVGFSRAEWRRIHDLARGLFGDAT